MGLICLDPQSTGSDPDRLGRSAVSDQKCGESGESRRSRRSRGSLPFCVSWRRWRPPAARRQGDGSFDYPPVAAQAAGRVDPAACDPGADASDAKPSAWAAEMPSGIRRALPSQVGWIQDPFLPRSVRRIRSGQSPPSVARMLAEPLPLFHHLCRVGEPAVRTSGGSAGAVGYRKRASARVATPGRWARMCPARTSVLGAVPPR